ncbi:dynamin family protein [Syntrophomonas palmitatica]|uniref:dynamin family protein n=1 Tax=Syntrophomonas palmitatica TaxID=402877 RepID=UPI000A803FF6|nr:dynamin family protein [Syntrophomonas palmitatica]
MDKEVQEFLLEIQSVCEEFGLHSVNKTLQRIKNFARQNQYIDVAVLGQFKAGKSSFLNSFLNKALLPVGNIPVTAVISRISYGPQEKVTVTFTDGSRQEISSQEIEDYVSESGNPENEKNVLLVDIELPGLEQIKTIRLVDTPGIGSVWKHNTETTTSWFPETGAVLFLISAEKPISENELTLLQEIYLYSPEIVIVLSKTDLFAEKHLQNMEKFTKDVLRQYFNKDFPLLRHSSHKATLEYNEAIKQDILLPLALNRDENFAKILRHKLESLSNNCLSYLEIAYEASRQKESDRKRLQESILDEHLHFHFIRRELLLIIGSYKEKNREQVYDYLNSFRGEIETRLKNGYRTAFPDWKGNLYSVSRQYENWLNQTLTLELQEILLKEEKSFELLGALKRHLTFYLKSFRERLSHNLEQVLGIKANLAALDISVDEIKKPSISISRAFDFHLDMLWFFFPMFIFRGIFQRYFEKQIDYEIDKNLHRLTSNMNERINKEMDSLMVKALSYINDELNMIETLLGENKGASDYILSKMEQIRL